MTQGCAGSDTIDFAKKGFWAAQRRDSRLGLPGFGRAGKSLVRKKVPERGIEPGTRPTKGVRDVR